MVSRAVSGGKVAASRSPGSPRSNTGGPESQVLVDWLAFTWSYDALSLSDVIGMLSGWFGRRVELQDRPGGYLHFELRGDLVVRVSDAPVTVGIAAWGGDQNKGRCYVSIPGTGCGLIPRHVWPIVARQLERFDARLTRVDLAVDDMEGRYSVDLAVRWYKRGLFQVYQGKPLKCDQRGNWIAPDGRGRTFYVGCRESGKLLRVYEKGKQLGDPDSLRVRWEVEFHNRDRVLPYAMLVEGAPFFAGAFGRLDRIVNVGAQRIRIVHETVERSLDSLVASAKSSYGRLVDTLLRHYDGDVCRVVSVLQRRGVPRSLSAAWLARIGLHEGGNTQ